MPARLRDLSPVWRRIYVDRDQTPDNGGFPTDNYTLVFQCPACGPPYRIVIDVGPGEPDAKSRRWKATPMPPNGPDWPNSLTISPSIDHTHSGHGPKHPTCGFHGTITNGIVTP